jgi:hypothetical protein
VAGRRPTQAAEEGIDARQVLELISLVAAPATLATALLYWFGFELVGARSEYFGLGIGTLGFSTTDYLLRGVEAGIVPLFVLLLVIGAVVAVATMASRLADRVGAARWFRWGVRVLVTLGLLITAVAIYGAFGSLPAPLDGYLGPPILLGAGPVMVLGGLRLLSRYILMPEASLRAGAVVVWGLVVLSAFWGMSLYADALGRGRAQELAQSLVSLPRVTIYSERSLAIDPAVVDVDVLEGPEDALFTHRYSGLRLLIRSDDKYFLLPDTWNPKDGRAFIIRDESEIRVELSPRG